MSCSYDLCKINTTQNVQSNSLSSFHPMTLLDISRLMKYYNGSCKLCKSVLKIPTILKLSVLGLFRPFDEIKFSIDGPFKKYIIVVTTFWDNSTFILSSLRSGLEFDNFLDRLTWSTCQTEFLRWSKRSSVVISGSFCDVSGRKRV